MAFFERLGVPLKVERGNRVFPVSDRAFDISAALERRLKALRVRWAHDRAVDIETADGAACGANGGGGIVCTGTPEEVAQCSASYTGRYLKRML